MALFKRNKQGSNLDTWISEVKTATDTNRYSALFVELVAVLRPPKGVEAAAPIVRLLQCLEQDKQLAQALRNMFVYLFNTRDCQSLFTHVGILSGGTFFSEMFRQLRHKLLPPLPDKRSMYYLLQQAFNKPDDYKWVMAVPAEHWIALFRIVSADMDENDRPFERYLTEALNVLSYKVTYLGLEDELSRKIKAEPGQINPFVEQNKKIQTFIYVITTGDASAHYLQRLAGELYDQLNDCQRIIDEVRAGAAAQGTSMEQSYLLLRATQQLQRITLIIRFLTPGDLPESTMKRVVNLFASIIESVNKRFSISDLYKKSSGMLAYQIAEHKSASGEHYITTTRSQYTDFFYSAAAGGVIIALAAVVKALLHKVHLAPFWQYFFYGFNYAVAFVILFLTGASLATKQPTMTASALASSLDSRKGGVSFPGLALTFGKVWRSQFASFMGNLIVVFPLAYLLSVAWTELTGTPLLHDKKEALQSLRDQNPLTSLAWVYACITGVCLFVSGIITGYVDNKVIYGNVAKRLKEHPGLKRRVPGESLNRFADFMARNLGGIVGNVCLGFMLGFAKLIGEFFGIPFDIRHITISTAYFAFGVDGLDNQLSANDWIGTTLGVIGIGFFNFLISFSLAFYVAIRSRNIPIGRLPQVGKLIWKYLIKFPQDFIYPPRQDRTEESVFSQPANTTAETKI